MIVVAGHETTAAAMFWACYLLARHPAEQERLAAEMFGIDLSPENAADIMPQLVRTRAVIDEVLRLYPAAFVIVRQALGDDIAAGVPGRGRIAGADRALDSASASPILGRARALRPVALPAGGAAAGAFCLYALRRRSANLRRRSVRLDRAGARAGDPGAELPDRVAAAQSGEACWLGHGSTGHSAAVSLTGAQCVISTEAKNFPDAVRFAAFFASQSAPGRGRDAARCPAAMRCRGMSEPG